MSEVGETASGSKKIIPCFKKDYESSSSFLISNLARRIKLMRSIGQQHSQIEPIQFRL